MPPLRRIIVWTGIFLLLLIIGTHYYFEGRRIAKLKTAVQESEELLEKKKESVDSYREKVLFYKTQEGIEHLAREQYNLVFPGERVILLRSPDQFPEEVH